jgi:hypothetical protein
MAKIYELKTGKLLADLPTTHLSKKRCMGFKLQNPGPGFTNLSGMINSNIDKAKEVLNKIEEKILKKVI